MLLTAADCCVNIFLCVCFLLEAVVWLLQCVLQLLHKQIAILFYIFNQSATFALFLPQLLHFLLRSSPPPSLPSLSSLSSLPSPLSPYLLFSPTFLPTVPPLSSSSSLLSPPNPAFTELQTDLADLDQISDKDLPYRDFRTFAMRFLFPKAGDNHPVLSPLAIDGIKLEEDAVIGHLKSFQALIMDKKFLLVFVRSLEAQGSFSLQDKCNVASLLMVAFQNDLSYATE